MSNSAYHLVPARYTDQITKRIWFQANKSLLFNKENILNFMFYLYPHSKPLNLLYWFLLIFSSYFTHIHREIIYAYDWSLIYTSTQVSLMSSACSSFLLDLSGCPEPNLNCPKWTSSICQTKWFPLHPEFSMHFDELLSHFLFLSQDCRQWACVFSPVPGMVPGIW